jgi:hypothetical protein
MLERAVEEVESVVMVHEARVDQSIIVGLSTGALHFALV